MKKAVFNWSGGKDSARCLYEILKHKEFDIITLLTSVNEAHDRISMHGVRAELLEQQVKNIGIPLTKLMLPESPSMEEYEKLMTETVSKIKVQGITYSIFGDIFLEDLRKYREEQLYKMNMTGVFPLWNRSTTDLIHEFIDLGFKTIVTCVNDKYLDESFAGRIIDHDFLKDLPANVDPCGENGEFHTFVFDGPIFKNPVEFTIGEKVHRKYDSTDDENNPFSAGFWFCDLY